MAKLASSTLATPRTCDSSSKVSPKEDMFSKKKKRKHKLTCKTSVFLFLFLCCKVTWSRSLTQLFIHTIDLALCSQWCWLFFYRAPASLKMAYFFLCFMQEVNLWHHIRPGIGTTMSVWAVWLWQGFLAYQCECFSFKVLLKICGKDLQIWT